HHAEGRFYLGLCLANLAEDEKAVEQLEPALAGMLPVALRNQALGVLGFLFGRRGQHEEALHYFEQLLAADPASVTARSGIGYACFELGQVDRALAMFSEGVARAPKNASLRNALGYVHLEGKNDIPRALAECEAALALDRNNGAIYDSLAWARHRQGDAVQARELIARARQLSPRHPLIERHHAVIMGEAVPAAESAAAAVPAPATGAAPAAAGRQQPAPAAKQRPNRRLRA
ncbi:MAG TPA: tetratricopeptide repeat protein, partial [bacterium]|nr:tetratricopeptide repeat protein [bacterium]